MRLSRPLTRISTALALAAGLSTGPALSQSLDFGLGSQVQGAGTGAVALSVEFRSQPGFQRGRLSGGWALAGRINNDGDAWLGIGYALQATLGAQWFVEGSFMPGLYRAGANDLGGALEFRTQVGLGYQLTGRSSVIVSFDHLSNAGTGSINPGVNTASLRYRMAL